MSFHMSLACDLMPKLNKTSHSHAGGSFFNREPKLATLMIDVPTPQTSNQHKGDWFSTVDEWAEPATDDVQPLGELQAFGSMFSLYRP